MKPENQLLLLGGMFALCLAVESWFPLREKTLPRARRIAVNLALASVGALFIRFLFFPLVLGIALWVNRERFGVLHGLSLTPLAGTVCAVVLLDSSLWFWHWLNHNMRFLWRFHNVHHVDLDLDVSTASRFHFGELVFSAGFRSLQVVAIGVDPVTLILYETLTTLAAQFHHSNIFLPPKLDRLLSWVIVTPRMHGIHHSIIREETDSNYAVIFSVWDRLHGTFRDGVPQNEITIGVPAYREPAETGLIRSLFLPFGRQREWKLPSGEVPRRKTSGDHR